MHKPRVYCRALFWSGPWQQYVLYQGPEKSELEEYSGGDHSQQVS